MGYLFVLLWYYVCVYRHIDLPADVQAPNSDRPSACTVFIYYVKYPLTNTPCLVKQGGSAVAVNNFTSILLHTSSTKVGVGYNRFIHPVHLSICPFFFCRWGFWSLQKKYCLNGFVIWHTHFYSESLDPIDFRLDWAISYTLVAKTVSADRIFSRHASRHLRHARVMMHVGIAN